MQRSPEMAGDVLSSTEFPGAWRIPGTDAALKLGGQVRLTLVHTLQALGTDDRFVTSSIPVAQQVAGRNRGRSIPQAFAPELRFPEAVRYVDDSHLHRSGLRRLRQHDAVAPRVHPRRRLLIGQTWSTFSDRGRTTRDRLRRPERDLAIPPAADSLHASAARTAAARRGARRPRAQSDGRDGSELHAGRHRAPALEATVARIGSSAPSTSRPPSSSDSCGRDQRSAGPYARDRRLRFQSERRARPTWTRTTV